MPVQPAGFMIDLGAKNHIGRSEVHGIIEKLYNLPRPALSNLYFQQLN